MPIPAEHRELTVKVDGRPLPRQHQLLSASVTKEVNRIAAARLVYLDGAAAAGDFPLSNDEVFLPGRSVEVLAGAGEDPVPLFYGVVVRQALKIRDHVAPQLIVECRHRASRLTLARRDAHYVGQSDSEIIEGLLQAAEVPAEVERIAAPRAQVTQYRVTDWDFLLERAARNGALVLTNDERVVVRPPRFDGTPACQLQFGATILDLDAEMDARDQCAAVAALTWSAAEQSVVRRDADVPATDGPGNVAGSDLADAVGFDLQSLHDVNADEEETQSWANARWLWARMNKVRGRVRCEGIASVNPGDLVTLSGVGERFSGDVFVTGVRHDLDLVQGWKTHLQFGGLPAATPPRCPEPAALPRVSGLQIGVVTGNEDPDNEHRVRVRLPLVDEAGDGIWARVASPDAGAERGFFFRPEIGDEVVVGFLEGDPRGPVLLGMLHSSAKPAPLEGSDDNHQKAYYSRSGMRLFFDDDEVSVRIDTPAGNRLLLSEKDKTLSLVDQNGNTVEMNESGVRVESAKDFTLKAAGALTLESGTSLSLQAGADLTLAGTSAAEISSAATTTVKGGLVQIN